MAPETDKPTRAKRRIRVWHVLLVLVVALVAVVLVLRWHWRSELSRRIEALAAAGYPVTPEELDASYTWPVSDENGADWVLGASTYFLQLAEEDHRALRDILGWPNRSGVRALPDDVRSLLVQHIQTNAKALELLHRCAAIEESRYPIDLSKGLMMLIPSIGDVRQCCLLLCFEAVLCVEEGDPEGAIDAIEAAIGVARTLRSEPAFISQLVYMAMTHFTTATAERLLCQCELTDAQLDRVAQAVSRAYEPGAALRGLVGIQCLNLELFMRPASIDPDGFHEFPPEAVVDLYSALGLAAREGVVFLDVMAECLAAAQQPTSERCRASAAIEARSRELSKSSVLLRYAEVPWYLLKAEVRSLACVRCSQVALAVERYRLGRGRLPETLAELVPDYLDGVPQDPYDGGPLRYKRLEQGFVVYSVGEDGVDEGGKERPGREDGKPEETYDLTFVVTR